MESIEKKIKGCIKKFEKKLEDNAELKAYEKTNDEFEALVKAGVVEKRGNQLLSSSESHLKSQVWFNTKR